MDWRLQSLRNETFGCLTTVELRTEGVFATAADCYQDATIEADIAGTEATQWHHTSAELIGKVSSCSASRARSSPITPGSSSVQSCSPSAEPML